MKDNNLLPFAEKITDGLNNFNFKQESFNEAMSSQHRTLQQNFTRMCMAWIEHQSQLDPNRSDHRNSASIKISKQMMDAFQESLSDGQKGFVPSKFLPFV